MTTHFPNKIKDISDLCKIGVKSPNSLAGKFDSSNINKVYLAKLFTHCPFTHKEWIVYFYCRGINKIPHGSSTVADISCTYASSHRMSNNCARGLPTIVDNTKHPPPPPTKAITTNKEKTTRMMA
jgi:hypothetical protein